MLKALSTMLREVRILNVEREWMENLDYLYFALEIFSRQSPNTKSWQLRQRSFGCFANAETHRWCARSNRQAYWQTRVQLARRQIKRREAFQRASWVPDCCSCPPMARIWAGLQRYPTPALAAATHRRRMLADDRLLCCAPAAAAQVRAAVRARGAAFGARTLHQRCARPRVPRRPRTLQRARQPSGPGCGVEAVASQSGIVWLIF